MHEAFKLFNDVFLRFVCAIAHHYVLLKLVSHIASQFFVAHMQLDVVITTRCFLGCRLTLWNYLGLLLGTLLTNQCCRDIIYRRQVRV